MSVEWRVAFSGQWGNLNLKVELNGQQRPVALIGPNGAGKSTILRMMAGAIRPPTGRFELGSRILIDTQEGIDSPPHQRRVGFVPQGFALFPHLNVLDNVMFGLRAQGMDHSTSQKRAQSILSSLNISHLSKRKPTTLSGGESQRVALARALVVEPQMLLFDEGLAALDVTIRRHRLQHLQENPRPTLLVTHDLRDVVALNAHVFVVEKGHIVQQGSPQALHANPATDFVAEFFSSPSPWTSPQIHA